MALYLLVTVECLWRHLVFSVLCTTGVFREGGVMCCKLSQSVHHITVGFVHCCFSSLCASLLFTVLVLVNYAVTWHHRLVSLFPSVNICCVFSVAGTRYSPRSLCRFCVVSFHVVYFILFLSLAFICLEVLSVLGWKASGMTSRKGGRVCWVGDGGCGFWGFYGWWGFSRASKILLEDMV